MEKFGRPRASSLHRRREQRQSLPAWEEEGDEGNLSPFLEDRPRALSLFAEVAGYRHSGPVDGESERSRAFSDPDRDRALSLPAAGEEWRVMANVEVGFCDIKSCFLELYGVWFLDLLPCRLFWLSFYFVNVIICPPLAEKISNPKK